MGKSAPPVPDYAAAATAQGAANVDAARATAWLNNPTQIGPGGTRTVSADPSNPDHMVVNTELSPEQQRLYWLQNHAQDATMTGLNEYGIPAAIRALQRGYSLPGSAATDFSAAYKPTAGMQFDPGTGGLSSQSGLDFSGAPAMPGADAGTRDKVSQSLYDQGARFLDPQFQQAQEGLDTKLSNQGIFSGSEAYGRDQDALGRQKMQAYGDLRDRAITGGGDAMAQLFGMGLGARQQGVGEVQSQGQFHNQAINDTVQRLLASMSATNQAVTSQYGIANQQAALANSGRAQNFQELTSGATLPVNVLTALMGQGQVQSPNFQPYTGGGTIDPAPIFGAAQAQYGANLNNANFQQAGLNNWLNAGSRIGSAFLMPTPSDRRLKSNVERIGTLQNGIPVYSFTMFGQPRIGVMADEVEPIIPEAVVTLPSGLKAVYYNMLGV